MILPSELPRPLRFELMSLPVQARSQSEATTPAPVDDEPAGRDVEAPVELGGAMDQPVEEVVMVDIEKETVEREVIVVPSLLATILSQCVTSLLPDRSHLRSAPANLRKFGTLPSTRGSMRWPGWERGTAAHGKSTTRRWPSRARRTSLRAPSCDSGIT